MQIYKHELGKVAQGHSGQGSDYRELTSNDKLKIVSIKQPIDEETKFHSHDDRDEIYIIISGTGIIRTKTEEKEVSQGDSIIFERNEEHSLKSTSDLHFLSVNIIN